MLGRLVVVDSFEPVLVVLRSSTPVVTSSPSPVSGVASPSFPGSPSSSVVSSGYTMGDVVVVVVGSVGTYSVVSYSGPSSVVAPASRSGYVVSSGVVVVVLVVVVVVVSVVVGGNVYDVVER